MPIARIYVDTSVIGGCFDEEFADFSLHLFDRIRARELIAVVSDLTLTELEGAPERVQNVLHGLPDGALELLTVSDEALNLSMEYIRSGVLREAMLADAQHIAVATVARVDVLVSWNFKHIVNLARIRGYNSINLALGYPMLEIRTPAEVDS